MKNFGKKQWLTIPEVAEATGLTVNIVRNACKYGEIEGAFRPAHTGSSRWRIPSQGAEDWFDIMRGTKPDPLSLIKPSTRNPKN